VVAALHALQHRGQESAGVAWRAAEGAALSVHKGMGLVAHVCADLHEGVRGPLAVGHTRYSTAGASRVENAQPFVVDGPSGRLALAHNGHLSDLGTLVRLLQEQGVAAPGTTDSAILAAAMAHAPGSTWPERIRWTLERVSGSYGLVLATDDGLYAVRDPMGNRPLSLARLGGADQAGWMAASETCAFLTIGAALVRDVAPGEIVFLGAEGPRTAGRVQQAASAEGEGFCAFEYIYLARPDSQFGPRTVYEARREMGRILAREQPVDADLVAAVPDSGITAALGFAAESGLPFGEALMKNRYVGRTFIHPGAESRSRVLALKFTPLGVTVAGKRIVLVDDSLVRGTTMRALVAMLRGAGAREVHLRIAAPAVRWPCFLGVDIPTTGELIAHAQGADEVCRHVGADSLGYLSVAGLAAATGRPGGLHSLCTGCFTGSYPGGLRQETASSAARGSQEERTPALMEGARG
jgi:amidophosphoribosyltransferase